MSSADIGANVLKYFLELGIRVKQHYVLFEDVHVGITSRGEVSTLGSK